MPLELLFFIVLIVAIVLIVKLPIELLKSDKKKLAKKILFISIFSPVLSIVYYLLGFGQDVDILFPPVALIVLCIFNFRTLILVFKEKGVEEKTLKMFIASTAISCISALLFGVIIYFIASLFLGLSLGNSNFSGF